MQENAIRGARKNRETLVPNLEDHKQLWRTFSWGAARGELDGLPFGAGLNIAHEAIDRHASGEKATVVAMRFIRKDGETTDYTYARMHELTNKFANVLPACTDRFANHSGNTTRYNL